MSDAATIRAELARINEVVAAARDLIADGQFINLAPLEGEVERICGGIGALSGTDAEIVKPALLALMDELDRLAGEMRERQGEYESELRSLASHRNAARAYHAVPAASVPSKSGK